MNICNEIYSKDITDIIVYNQSDVAAALSPSVPGLTSLKLSSLGTPLATISIREADDVDMVMDVSPNVKVTSIRQGKGLTYTHDITAVAAYFPQKAAELIEKAKNIDIHLIYRCIDNTYCMSYGFPESTSLTVEDNVANGRNATIKAQVNSLSPLIEVELPDKQQTK